MYNILKDNNNSELKKAQQKFLAHCDSEGQAGKKIKDIEMDLVTIPCTWNLLKSIKDTEHYKNHMNTSHGIDMQSIKSSFSTKVDCRTYDKLSAIGHTTFPPMPQKSVRLLVPSRDLRKIASESSLPELSNHV